MHKTSIFHPDTAEREIIATAMNEYEKDTCITFVPRTEEVDYIVITAGGSGYRSKKKQKKQSISSLSGSLS